MADDIALPDKKVTDKDVKLVQIWARRDMILRVCDVVGYIGCVGVLYFPLSAATGLAYALAGKETILDAKIAAGLTLTVSSAAGGLITHLLGRKKMQEQAQELRRLRERSDKLEKERNQLTMDLEDLKRRAKK